MNKVYRSNDMTSYLARSSQEEFIKKTSVSQDEFINQLVESVQAGFGIVPFVGSGASAASGIMMGIEFTEYLTYCVWKSVAASEPNELLQIVVDGWPNMPNRSEVFEATKWARGAFETICSSYHVSTSFVDNEHPNKLRQLFKTEKTDAVDMVSAMLRPLVPAILKQPGYTQTNDDQVRDYHRAVASDPARQREPMLPETSPTSPSFVEEAAVRSLHDWRSMLRFISRLAYPKHLNNRPVLAEANQALVDSFNSHITRGRRPNFTHTMLAHLAVKWRSQIFLTTNFDSLIEDALAALGEQYEVIPVSLRDPLPHPDTVHAQSCIVKLHGSRTETRADDSLDDMPSHEDRRRFFHYVRGRFPDTSKGQGFLPSNLFVCGYSANDMRCVQMIKHLLDNDPETKVYWVCFTVGDIKWLAKLFADHYKDNFVIIRSDRPDLLLYDIYQKLTLCLPRGGVSYQYAEDAPPAPYKSSQKPSPPFDLTKLSNSADIFDARLIAAWQKDIAPVFCAEGRIGVTNPLREVFLKYTHAGAKQGVWLELEDFVDVAHVAHELLQIIALRRGRYQLDHAVFPWDSKGEMTWVDRDNDEARKRYSKAKTVFSEWRKQWELLIEEWIVDPKYWLIVFHARNGAGSCAGWTNELWGEGESPLKEYRILHDFMQMLSESGFRVIYAPYTLCRWESELDAHLWFEGELDTIEKDFTRETKATPRKLFLDSTESDHSIIQTKKVAKNEPHRLNTELVRQIESDIQVLSDADKTPFQGNLWLREILPENLSTAKSFKDIIKEIHPKWLPVVEVHSGEPNSTNKEVDVYQNDPGKKRKFLYCFSLFRHARHFSALLSTAMNECPRPFNVFGVDNDWMRDKVVQGWLRELGDDGFLFLKPGGYVWIHRDIRLALQTLAERGISYRVASKEERGTFLFQRRATNHFQIANWYGKAFNTTGHAQPFLESLYHYFQCIKWAPHSHPGGNVKNHADVVKPYRCGHIRVSLNWIIKLLRMGQRSIEFWIQAPMAKHWFGHATQDKLVQSIRDAYQKCAGAKEDWLETSIELFRIEMAAIDAMLDCRPVYDFPHYVRFGKAGAEHLNKNVNWSKTPRIIFSDERQNKTYEEWIGSIQRGLKRAIKTNSREGKQLGLLLAKLQQVVQKPTENFSVELEKKIREWRISSWTWGQQNGLDSDVGPLMVTECLTELAYSHVRYAKLEEHLFDSGRLKHSVMLQKPDQVNKYWAITCGLCHAANLLGSHVHPNCIHAELLQRVKALTLYGLALGRLGRFYEAHRRLNEADALLSKSDFARDSVQMAIIQIRRAEVHVLEARLIGELVDVVSSNELPFGSRDNANEESRLIKIYYSELYLGEESCDILEGSGNSAARQRVTDRLLRLHYAKLNEAWITLESAERFLGGQTHASLWWTRLWTLQMRVFADHHPKWLHRESPDAAGFQPAVRTLAFRERKKRVGQVTALFHKAIVCSTSGEDYKYWLTRQFDYFIRAFATAWLVDHDKDPFDGKVPSAKEFENELHEEIRSALDGLKDDQREWFSKSSKRRHNNDKFDQYCHRVMSGNVSLYQSSVSQGGNASDDMAACIRGAMNPKNTGAVGKEPLKLGRKISS